MKLRITRCIYLLGFTLAIAILPILGMAPNGAKFFKPSDSRIQYFGRVDFSNPELPRFYASGVYIIIAFSGKTCEINLNDEELYGKSHNYITIVLDKQAPKRIKLKEAKNVLNIGDGLGDGPHQLTICKGTESGIGFLEFAGIRCEKLLTPPKKPSRKIEFIGNSITSGTGSDLTIPCGSTADWYDQHNAYMSYGPITARKVNAQWQLTSASGIGLMKSCCNMKTIMPDIYDKINLRDNTINWDFSKYQPDVVTVCLGQNDGIQDSTVFCGNYVSFLKSLRKVYPKATLVCITSPMADDRLVAVQKRYLSGVVASANAGGDKNVNSFFFSRRWNKGCGGHPSLDEHLAIGTELSAAIRKIKKW